MKNRKFYKFLSFILSLILLLNFTPNIKASSDSAVRAIWVVNSLADDDDGSCAGPDCTLREAINLSNSGDIINFETSLAGSAILLNSTLTIDNDLTIDNSDHKNRVILDGQGTDNIMDVAYGVSLTVKKLTFQNGFATGGAINSDHGLVTIFMCNFISNGTSIVSAGGALRNQLGTMTITRSSFSNNTAINGGAIYNSGHLTISDSTFENNSAVWRGGAIFNSLGSITDMNLEINNSTFSGNTTDTYEGGAINNESHGPLEVTNSTFEGNSAMTDGGGIFSFNATDTKITHSTFSGNSAGLATEGGGLHILGSLRMYNSILANSVTGYDCYWNYIDLPTSINNLIENNATSTNACGTPLLTSDPALDPLDSNGGFTKTMALPETSPAVDQGNVTYCETEDQRGVIRPSGPGCDLGAYEYEYPDTTPPIVSSIITIDPNPTYAAQVQYEVTFSENVTYVDISDFNLRDTGLSSCSIIALSGSGAVYTVTATTGTGIGTLRLDLLDDGTIFDDSSNQLGGPGTINGNFTNGEEYMVRYLATFLPFISRE